MSSTFSLGIVKLLGEIMTNNASLAHKHNVDVRKVCDMMNFRLYVVLTI